MKEPRSYDYAKLATKDYNDRLRMPLFPLNHEQHEEIITFVLGLVADSPREKYVYRPNPRQQAVEAGEPIHLDKPAGTSLEALAQLHAAGAVATAVRLQEAIDSLEWPPKNDGSPT